MIVRGTGSRAQRSGEERPCQTPAHPPARPDQAAVQEFATKIFDLARAGDAGPLAAYVDAGVPANLTNDSGDTLVMLAAYHGHAPAVRALLERGADPGRPNDRGRRRWPARCSKVSPRSPACCWTAA